MTVVGKKFNRSGTDYKVIAYNEREKIMALENMSSEFKGTVDFLCDASYDDGMMSGGTSYSYFIEKDKYYEVAEKTGSKNIDEISKAIHQKYEKIPIVFCELIAQSYVDRA